MDQFPVHTRSRGRGRTGAGHLLIDLRPSGLLRINAPASFGSKYLLDVLPRFMHRYPQVKLEVEFNDRLIDLVAEGYDVVIRVSKIKDSNLVARKFTSSKAVLRTVINLIESLLLTVINALPA